MAFRIPFDQGFWQDYLSGQEANLPALKDVEFVTERVCRVLGGNPGPMQLQGTNTYLVGTGRERILIDTGEGAVCWINRITRILEQRHISISHVLLTHWHGDHTGGVADLVRYDSRLRSQIYKNQRDYGQNEILHGQVFKAPGATIRAVFSPGHAVDHMCFVLEEENALFTGDNVLGHGYSVVQDLNTYMKSLKVMAAEDCALGYPAHGARIEDLPAKMREYINHKEFRVRQVFAALARSKSELEEIGKAGRGGMTLSQIVESIYGAVDQDLFDKALAPFLTQVLWKLAEDRKVGFEGEPCQATRKWFATRPSLRA